MPVDNIMTSGFNPASLPSNVQDAVKMKEAPRRQDLPQAASDNGKKTVEDTSPENIAEAASRLNSQLQTFRRDLQFTVDQDSGQTVIKVVDSETKEVIRQIPPEELLALARSLGEMSKSVLLNAKV
jgi:flagellar protein FlaG